MEERSGVDGQVQNIIKICFKIIAEYNGVVRCHQIFSYDINISAQRKREWEMKETSQWNFACSLPQSAKFRLLNLWYQRSCKLINSLYRTCNFNVTFILNPRVNTVLNPTGFNSIHLSITTHLCAPKPSHSSQGVSCTKVKT